MSELALVATIVIILILVPVFTRILPPDALVVVIIVVLNLIKLFITVINSLQAIHRSERFLNPVILSLITLVPGLMLLAGFGFVMGHHGYTYFGSLPFIASGIYILLLSLLVVAIKGKKRQGQGDG